MAGFPRKCTFFLSPAFNPKLEMFFLHCSAQILHRQSLDTGQIIRVKQARL